MQYSIELYELHSTKKESEHLLYFNYIIYTNPINSQWHIYQIKYKFLPYKDN